VTSAGVQIYPGANPGGMEPSFRASLLGTGHTGLGSLYNSIVLNLPYMGYGFLGYPGAAADPRSPAAYPTAAAYVAGFDFDADPVRLAPGRLLFHGDNLDPSRPGPNFENFLHRGGRMIVFSGTADASVKAPGVQQFMDRLRSRYSPEGADTFARAFFVPGMGHCAGGKATDRFDVLTPLVDWVEKGVPPERIVASATPGNALDPNRVGITRPLCPYPRYARYNGSGDRNAAASYSCVAD
jgi:feruloyl esterase